MAKLSLFKKPRECKLPKKGECIDTWFNNNIQNPEDRDLLLKEILKHINK